MRKQVEESTAAESARRATGAAAERDRPGVHTLSSTALGAS